MARSRCSSRRVASMRCAGTSSPGATASSSRNPPASASGWQQCASRSPSITIQPIRSDVKPRIVSDRDRVPDRSMERSDWRTLIRRPSPPGRTVSLPFTCLFGYPGAMIGVAQRNGAFDGLRCVRWQSGFPDAVRRRCRACTGLRPSHFVGLGLDCSVWNRKVRNLSCA